ncbi:hypothetical protein HOLleu_02901 [Holothuria leucospilota]|uniref:Uncharacterized protein n=1 Tax=Holothuria leucospilota TaxID=206669 RepID=A0A9Q1HHC1_HOLLE|nr:hypothetical protein HOLleu_02901 [Holothuria leucospilota]
MSRPRFSAEEVLQRVFEGSESSDEDVVNFLCSEPLEPALQESALFDVPELLQQEEFEPTLEELEAAQRGLPLQEEEPEPQPQPEPAPKRQRGRPRKPPAEVQPPQEGPQTPTPVRSKAQRDACSSRSLGRRRDVQRVLGQRHVTAEEVQGTRSLLVEDEQDRHDNLGAWIWSDCDGENVSCVFSYLFSFALIFSYFFLPACYPFSFLNFSSCGILLLFLSNISHNF